MLLVRPVMLSVTLTGCSTPASAPDAVDRTRYAALLADQDRAPGDALRACSALVDDTLRGDCQLAAVGRMDMREAGDLGPQCRLVDRGRTRDECWFMVAEQRLLHGADSAAAAACGSAGGYADDCARHLWEEAVLGLASSAPPPRWDTALPAIKADIARWATLLPQIDDLPLQMWRRFYERGLGRPGARLDLRPCGPLPRADAQRCRRTGTELYARRLARRADAQGIDLCAREPRVGSWQELQPAVPHPRLDAAVVRLAEERCGQRP
ncbi:MAG: hypothetical protein VX265_18815 [Myxococcota bacterium]|nr:hypothetical protein [Myxococcota bacterium]MEC8425609.1 hypothetical protein [Myxococcota bacterium]